MDARCRLCAEYSKDQINVHKSDALVSKIEHLFRIKIDVYGKLPTDICTLCNETVNNTWVFYNRAQKAQDLLSGTYDDLDDKDCSFTLIQNTFNDDKIADSERRKFKLKRIIDDNKCKKLNNHGSDTKLVKQPTATNDGSNVIKNVLSGWEFYKWTCFECNQIFTSAQNLRDHYTTVHFNSPRYICIDCPKVYNKYLTFLAHVKVHHPQLSYGCDICYKYFPKISCSNKHRLQHDRSYICSVCGKQFRLHSSLLAHARSHLSNEVKTRHQCDQCSKHFSSKSSLTAHKRIHTGIREYTCDQCGKSFVQKGSLDNHLVTHSVPRPFECNICNKTFKTLLRLKAHHTVHSGIKPHQCDVCGRQFREKRALKEHYRIHTGVLPYSCEFCGKYFRFKGVLTTHRRQHTGEKPYSCVDCQHDFTNWANYNKHMKRRHGINTSVNCRTKQDIPPTGMPHRNSAATIVDDLPNNIPETTLYYPEIHLGSMTDDYLSTRV